MSEKPASRTSVESVVLRSHWPVGLEFRHQYKFKCDDCGPEDIAELRVTISDDGDVWVGMSQIEGIRDEEPYANPHPSVRCRTGVGGGRHRRTRQALLWLARAIQLDNEGLGIVAD